MNSKRKGLGKGFKPLSPQELSDYYSDWNICVRPVINDKGNFIWLLPKSLGGIAKPKCQYPLETIGPDVPLGELKVTKSWDYDQRVLHYCIHCNHQFYLSVYSVQNNGAKNSNFRYRVGHGCVRCMEKRPKGWWGQFRSDNPLLNAKRMEQQIKDETGADFTCLNPQDATHTHKIKLQWQCNVCGHESETEFYGLVGAHQHGCPGCKGMIWTEKTFAKELKESRDDLTLIGNFVSSDEYTDFHCNKCDKVFESTPRAILSGKQCEHCGSKSESLMARRAKEYFVEKTGRKIREISERTDILKNPETNYPLRPDVYVEAGKSERSLWVEVNGQQHYETKVLYSSPSLIERDLLKENFCKNNKINYLAISQPFFQLKPKEWKKVFDCAIQKSNENKYFHVHIKTLKDAEEFLKC